MQRPILRPAWTGKPRRAILRADVNGGHREGDMSNKMWGGRFTERPDEIMEEINVSIDVDRHL